MGFERRHGEVCMTSSMLRSRNCFPCLSVYLCLVQLLLFPVTRSQAQSPDKQDQPDYAALARVSEVVVVGRVESVQSRWVGKKIYSMAAVSPLEQLKGRTPTVLKVVFAGGTVGNITQTVSHEPELIAGEIALLYLRSTSQKSLESGLRIVSEAGVVRLVAPHQKTSRLQNNKRIRMRIAAARAEIGGSK